MEGLAKVYPPATRALRDFSLDLYPGEVHGLAGVNGAGKSTVIKLLTGVERPTAGEISLAGVGLLDLHGPGDATRYGIGVVHQELPLVPTMTVADNASIGLEGARWFAPRRSHRRTRQYLETAARFPTAPLPGARLEELSVYAWQVAAIVRALRAGVRLLILDEPTSSLNVDERRSLHELMRELAQQGTAVLYVSHFLEDVLGVADGVTVLRDGGVVFRGAASSLTPRQLLTYMVGEEDAALIKKGEAEHAVVRALPSASRREGLVVQGLRTRRIGPVSLDVSRGERVGLYGLAGSGAGELLEAIFGLQPSRGAVSWDGTRLSATAAKRIEAGLGFVTGDRRRSLLADWSVAMNHSLPEMATRRRTSLLKRHDERRRAAATIEQLSIVGSPDSRMRALSGGNQQKVSLGRWLERSHCLLADEPTRGVDARGRAAIHELLIQHAARGNTLLVHSTDPEELVALCDRVLAIADGVLAGEVAGERLSVASLEGAVRSRSRATHDDAAYSKRT